MPAFPKASYCVQQGEYEDANAANERTKASYRRDNFTPVAQANQWDVRAATRNCFLASPPS